MSPAEAAAVTFSGAGRQRGASGRDAPRALRYGDAMTAARLRLFALALSLLVAAAIAVFGLLPPPALPQAPGGDKLHHFLAFAALVFPAVAVRPRIGLWLVPLAAAYGGLIELVQPLVGRHGEWGDVIANAAGAVAGAGLGWAAHVLLLRPLRRRRQARPGR